MVMAFNPNKTAQGSNDFDTSFMEIEIEAIDHSNVQYAQAYALITNAKKIKYKDIVWITNNSNSNFQYNVTVPIAEEGEYRIYLHGMNHTGSGNPYCDIVLPSGVTTDGSTTLREYWKRKADYPQMRDLGTAWFKKGNHKFMIRATAGARLGNIILKKVRRLKGNTKGEGVLVCKNWQFSDNDIEQNLNSGTVDLENLNFDIRNGGFLDENSPTGWIFDWRDSINIFAGRRLGDVEQIFGGYITELNPNKEKTIITLGIVDRLLDSTLIEVVEEIIVGGHVPDTDVSSVHCSNVYEAIKFCMDTFETPINYDTLTTYIKNRPKISSNWSYNSFNSKVFKDAVTKDAKILADELKKYNKTVDKLEKAAEKAKKKWDDWYNKKSKAIDSKYVKALKTIDNSFSKTQKAINKKYAKSLKAAKSASAKAAIQTTKKKEMDARVNEPKKAKKAPIEAKKKAEKEPFDEKRKAEKKTIETNLKLNLNKAEKEYVNKVMKDSKYTKWIQAAWKSATFNSSKKNYLELTNAVHKGIQQSIIVWENSFESNPKKNIVINKTYGILEFDYGMMSQYDDGKPFVGTLKLEYQKKGNTKNYIAFIDFTGNVWDSAPGAEVLGLGVVTPQIQLGTLKSFQFDVHTNLWKIREAIGLGDTENTEYILKRLSFVNTFVPNANKTDKEDHEYDPEKDPYARKMLFGDFKIRGGDIVIPLQIKSSGKYALNIMRDLLIDANMALKAIPGKSRRDDILYIEDRNSKVETHELVEGDNIIGKLDDIKYSPNGNVINHTTKIYTNSDGKEIAVYAADIDSIYHYGTTNNHEVLSKDIHSIDMATYYARNSLSPEIPPWSYSVDVKGVSQYMNGRLITAKITESYLSSLREIKSVQRTFNNKHAPMLYTSLGLDDVALEFRTDIGRIRKLVDNMNTKRSSGATVPDAVDI